VPCIGRAGGPLADPSEATGGLFDGLGVGELLGDGVGSGVGVGESVGEGDGTYVGDGVGS